MKKMLFIGFLLAAGYLAVVSCPLCAEQDNDDPSRLSGWFCPWCGGEFERYDPDREIQDTTRRYHHWMGFDHRRPTDGGPSAYEPMDRNRVVLLVNAYIRSQGKPGLRIGGIVDKDVFYEAVIMSGDGIFVSRLLVDKETGEFLNTY